MAQQQHRRSYWVKTGGVIVVAVAIGFALAIMMTKKHQAPQPAAKSAAVSETGKSSRQPRLTKVRRL